MIALGKGLKYEGRKFGFSELYLHLWSLGRFFYVFGNTQK